MTNDYVTKQEFRKFKRDLSSKIERFAVKDLFNQPAESLVGIRFEDRSELESYFTYLVERGVDSKLIDSRTLLLEREKFERIGVPATIQSYRIVPVRHGP